MCLLYTTVYRPEDQYFIAGSDRAMYEIHEYDQLAAVLSDPSDVVLH